MHSQLCGHMQPDRKLIFKNKIKANEYKKHQNNPDRIAAAYNMLFSSVQCFFVM